MRAMRLFLLAALVCAACVHGAAVPQFYGSAGATPDSKTMPAYQYQAPMGKQPHAPLSMYSNIGQPACCPCTNVFQGGIGYDPQSDLEPIRSWSGCCPCDHPINPIGNSPLFASPPGELYHVQTNPAQPGEQPEGPIKQPAYADANQAHAVARAVEKAASQTTAAAATAAAAQNTLQKAANEVARGNKVLNTIAAHADIGPVATAPVPAVDAAGFGAEFHAGTPPDVPPPPSTDEAYQPQAPPYGPATNFYGSYAPQTPQHNVPTSVRAAENPVEPTVGKSAAVPDFEKPTAPSTPDSSAAHEAPMPPKDMEVM